MKKQLEFILGKQLKLLAEDAEKEANKIDKEEWPPRHTHELLLNG